MIARAVAWSARHHWLVIAGTLLLAMAGELARRTLARDVVPDLSDPQIVLVVDWMGHPATEVANKVTTVLTEALDGIPGSKAIRGSSMSGMAYVDVVFDTPSSLAKGREAILDRTNRARSRLPAKARIQIGPLASSTGWVFQYALIDPTHGQTPGTLRHLQDDILRPALQVIPGVVEVASMGGRVEQVLVDVNLDRLRERGLAFTDVLATLRPRFEAETEVRIEELGELEIVRPPAAAGAADNRAASHDSESSVLRLRDVARVRFIEDMSKGMADLGGVWPAVGGIVVAGRNADLSTLIEAVNRTLDRERARFPPNVKVITTYDRLDLATRVVRTLIQALGEEVGVVVLVILMFLLHGRSALVPLATLPVVLLLTFSAMWLLSVPATIMSLGGIGIALGMAVDADVVALEACHRRLEIPDGSPSPATRRAKLLEAAGSFTPAILTSLLITALTFLPVLAFSGETGRLLRPLALTKTLVIASAGLVAITLAPALRDRLLVGRVVPEFDNPLTRGLVRIYRPFVHFALTRPVLTLVTALLAIISCLPIVPRLGGEFLPRVDEGDLLFMPTTLPGVSPHEAFDQLQRQDRAIAQFDEVATVFGKVGRADTATDPAPFSMVETTVRLRPREQWSKVARARWYDGWAPGPLRRLLGLVWPSETPETTAELVARLDSVARLPGWTSAWTAPARARMDMMSTGVRTPVGIRIVAPDASRLDALGTALRALALRVPGTRSAVFESLGGERWMRFTGDPAAMARHGVDPALVESTTDLLLTGGQIGELAKDGPRVRVGADESLRGPADQIRDVTVRAQLDGSSAPVPLALLGRPSFVSAPAMVRTEQGHLVAYVYVDIEEGVDLVGFVQRSQREVDHALSAREIELGPGERIEWTGQYDLLAAGQRRLKWIVPLVIASMLGLLFLQFRSFVEAVIVLMSVPFALVGSVWSLFLVGYSVSAPVWVGLLSVVGLAMQTGVVMVVYIDEAFFRRVREGKLTSRDDIVAAHAEGTVLRLRPKIMTVATMAAGLLPLLWAEGAGTEIMRRVAVPMIGGLASSAFLTLEVLPVLYTIWRYRQLRHSQRTGIALTTIVGAGRSWARPSRGDG